MRYWLHSSVRGTAFTPSATFSVVTHALLIGAAVHGTGINARNLSDVITQRITYLPPPDRRGGKSVAVERLQFLDVGGGAFMPATGTGGTPPQGGPRQKPRAGGEIGSDHVASDRSAPDPSPDSVYSVLEVEERAARTASSAAPVYPPDLMKAGTEGAVSIRFVVDTTGRADPATVEIVNATNALFAESVRTAVPQMSFTPAMVGGRRVRQAVEQNFEFRITPPVPAPAEQTRTKPVP